MLVIIFFIIVAVLPYKLTIKTYENSYIPKFSCQNYADENFLAREYTSESYEKWMADKARCEDVYAVSEKAFFIYGAISYIVFFYMLQILYFFVLVNLIRYVISGEKKK